MSATLDDLLRPSDPKLRDFVERCHTLSGRGTKPTLPEVRALVAEFYAMEDNGAGGSLHIVLDDHNTELYFIRSCQAYAAENGDAAGVALAGVLLLLSGSQRRKL